MPVVRVAVPGRELLALLPVEARAFVAPPCRFSTGLRSGPHSLDGAQYVSCHAAAFWRKDAHCLAQASVAA